MINRVPGRVTAVQQTLEGPQDVRADQWIKNFRADQYWIKEDSVQWSGHTTLSLIWWENERQLIDLDNFEEESGSWRSDGRRDWD